MGWAGLALPLVLQSTDILNTKEMSQNADEWSLDAHLRQDMRGRKDPI